MNTKKAKADQVAANGVTIESGALFDFKTVGNKKLTAGKVFAAISNTAATAINGAFVNLADGSTVTVGVNKLQGSYSGGDGNDLTLTVVRSRHSMCPASPTRHPVKAKPCARFGAVPRVTAASRLDCSDELCELRAGRQRKLLLTGRLAL